MHTPVCGPKTRFCCLLLLFSSCKGNPWKPMRENNESMSDTHFYTRFPPTVTNPRPHLSLLLSEIPHVDWGGGGRIVFHFHITCWAKFSLQRSSDRVFWSAFITEIRKTYSASVAIIQDTRLAYKVISWETATPAGLLYSWQSFLMWVLDPHR